MSLPKNRSLKEILNANLFIVYSFGCALCFGIHNYMMSQAMHTWRNSVSVLFPEFIPLIITHAVYHFYKAYNAKQTGGQYWSKDRSIFFENGKFRMAALFVIFNRSLTADLIPICISLVAYFCKKINVNPAVVQTFTTFSSFTTAVLFFVLYNERLRLQHVGGMILIVVSVMIVAIAKSM